MKKLVLLFTLMIAFGGQSQVLKPVKWATSVKKISATEYELIATATIDKGWHLYSQTIPADGPKPTKFIFPANPKFLKKGNTVEEQGHTVNDPIFEMKIKYFENKASFKQRIKLKGKAPFKVKATVEYMVCDDSRCLPPTEEDLEFSIK
ncbi:protein-disulfide reductase DsbD domain-containing protein [Flavobacterium flavipallidum]|uniref:Protein-disulfide reductase DsbD domain-containing protein n=1 Tax=Flavobacterium flavipallidum TaxID=3139140 RepID=A0ABU9HNI9_9FLAO